MIKSLQIKSIRNFSSAGFSFKPGLNLIIGSNGAGKTTILETISFLAYGRFLSIAQDSFAIARGGEAGRLVFQLENEAAHLIEIGIGKAQKLIKTDDQQAHVSSLVGLVPQVIFNPESVELVFDSPQLRRRELDMTLTQADHDLVAAMLQFRKVLKERNALLRAVSVRQASTHELDFWNEKFVHLAMLIHQGRIELIDYFNQFISAVFAQLGKKTGELSLKYLPSAHYDRLAEILVARAQNDIENGLTGVGPHRDDFAFQVDRHSMREGASRGEQRLAAVAFKALSSRFLQEKGIRPIILLDDVFSELDPSRQEAVAGALEIFSAKQVFVSATDEESLPKRLLEKANIIRLNDKFFN